MLSSGGLTPHTELQSVEHSAGTQSMTNAELEPGASSQGPRRVAASSSAAHPSPANGAAGEQTPGWLTDHCGIKDMQEICNQLFCIFPP
uniref:Uncharacterized protein n=1 Tax=Knipowitschia caucasica TaxID=637954 RepID=A0AAV2IUT7_KNICA